MLKHSVSTERIGDLMTEAFLEPVNVCAVVRLPQTVRDRGYFLSGRMGADVLILCKAN